MLLRDAIDVSCEDGLSNGPDCCPEYSPCNLHTLRVEKNKMSPWPAGLYEWWSEWACFLHLASWVCVLCLLMAHACFLIIQVKPEVIFVLSLLKLFHERVSTNVFARTRRIIVSCMMMFFVLETNPFIAKACNYCMELPIIGLFASSSFSCVSCRMSSWGVASGQNSPHAECDPISPLV